MSALLEPLVAAGDPRRYFLATYQRTTRAVGEAIDEGLFEDGAWVEAWDVAFADLYLDAVEADDPPGPWRQSFAADPDLPPLRHVLLGINAHINYDLPQALLAVITDEELDDHLLMARRRADHERIDEVLSARVTAEDDALAAAGPRSLTDRLLTPLNRHRHETAAPRGPPEGLGQHGHAVVRAPDGPGGVRPTARRPRGDQHGAGRRPHGYRDRS